MPVSLEKPPLTTQPGQNPTEMLYPSVMPPTMETASGFQIPTTEVLALGADAIEHSETVEERPGTGQEADIALWNKIATLSSEDSPYPSASGALVGRIPLSLPMRSQSEYSAGAIHFASGPDIKSALEANGVDASVIEESAKNNWRVEAAKLPQELQATIQTANLYEAMTMSHDPEQKRLATERNSHVTLEDVWQPSTLHHVTSVKKLGSILKDGHQSSFLHEINGQEFVTSGSADGGGNINFGRPLSEIAPDATNQQKIENLAYSTQNSGEVYIHYARPEGGYREGEEYIADDKIISMAGGMPATEISAVTMRRSVGSTPESREKLNSVRDEIVESGFYVPIFTLEGELAYSRQDFDADIEAKEAGTYETEAKRGQQRQAEQQVKLEQADKERRVQEAREAVEHNMSVDEYRQHKAIQPPPVM